MTISPPPPVQILINVGGGSYVDSIGRTWSADNSFTGGSTYAAAIAIANTTDDTLYHSERYGSFSYAIPVPAAGCYQVSLHFAEIWFGVFGGGGDGSRVFSLDLEGSTLISSYDIHAAAGPAAADIQSVNVDVTDGVLNIDTVPIVENPKLSAIEMTANSGGCGGGGDDPITGLSISSNSPIVLGQTAAFTATVTSGSNISYAWDFGDGTVVNGGAAISHVYATSGNFPVSVTASNSAGPVATSVTMVVQPPPPDPITGLTVSNNGPIAVTQPAQFNATVTGGTEISYSWDFGDGTVRAGSATDSHTYAAPGSYLVTVTANNSVSSANAQTTIVVNPPPDDPITGLSVSSNSPVETGQTASFTTTVTGGSNISYVWDFGDGTIINGAAIADHVYASAGSYTVVVTASNNVSTAAANTTMVVTDPPPPDDPITGLAVAGQSPVAVGSSASFTATVAGGSNISYSWDFGDGTIVAGGSTISHAYAVAGSYTVSVTASNNVSSDTTSMSVTVDMPVAGLSVSSNSPIETGETASFTASVSAGTNLSYSWDFGDGTVVTGGPTADHVYAAAGSYSVSVTASNGVSADTATTTMVVTDPPPPDDPITGLAVAGQSPVAVGSSAAFTATVTGGTNLSYNWDFGDGTVVAGGSSINHVYAAAGSYTVTVTASNNVGSDSASTNVAVELPVTGLTVSSNSPIETGETASFTASIAAGTSVSYEWDFGDGTVVTGGPTADHIYAAAGSYTVAVTASNGISAQSASTTMVVTDPPPPDDPITGLAVVGQSPLAVGTSGAFTATISGGTNISYSWDFGDGTIVAGGSTINHAYAAAGAYTVTVTASNNVGSEIAATSVTVEVPVTGLSLSSNSPVTLGGFSSFTASIAAGTNVTYDWDYGNGLTFTGGPSQSIVYAAAGSYTVEVTARNGVSSQTTSIVMVVNDAPPFQLLINVGGGSYVDTLGRTWVADSGFTGGSTYDAGIAIANTADDVLYQFERYGSFAYDLPLATAGCYNVELHFAEIWFGVFGGGGDGSRIFDVLLEGSVAIDDIDIHALVGPAAATSQDFDIMVTDGSLDIDVAAVVENPKLSAIAINYVGATCP